MLRNPDRRQDFNLSEPQRCFCLSGAKGKNREAGSRDFSVKKNTCDDIVDSLALFAYGVWPRRKRCGLGHECATIASTYLGNT